MVEPVTACAIGVTAAVTWGAEAASLAWDLTKGVAGNELHLRLRERLPSVYAHFARDRLPPNHDLERAAKEALQRALLSFAAGLRATTDATPTLRSKALAWLRRGPRFESHEAAWRREEEAGWLKAFRKLVDDDGGLAELELICATTARELLATVVHEPARELLHLSVQAWAERHMTDVPGWPAAWRDCLQQGWRIGADDEQRVTLYQAWALHFREAVKHRPAVFNIFAATALADGLPAAGAGSLEAVLRDALEAQTSDLAERLERIEAQLGRIEATTERTEQLVQQVLAALPATAAGQPFAELPAPPPHFMGRDTEVADLVNRLTRAPGGAGIITEGLRGMGGLGKTALALAVGHAARAHFTGGALFFRLGAHSGSPQSGMTARRRWLEWHAVAGEGALPDADEDAQPRYLARLGQAPGPVLVVVDDPADERDIRALRPRAGDALLVTARKPLAGLQPLELKALPAPAARALLRSVGRADLSDAEATVLARRCAWLPAVLLAAAGFLARRPGKPVADYLAELDADRLQALAKAANGDAELDVRVVLDYSLRQLAADERAALHALCVMPADFPRTIGAAVAGGNADLLDALAEAGVLEVDGERYLLHDLMREVAMASVASETLQAARGRHAEAMLGWVRACNAGYDSAEAMAPQRALSAFAAERRHLDAALRSLQTQPERSELFSNLVWSLVDVGAKLMPPQDRLPWHESAAQAVFLSGDRRAQAAHLLFQSSLQRELGRVTRADDLARQGLDINRKLAGELNTLEARRDLSVSLDRVGSVMEVQGEWSQAQTLYEESLGIARELANQLGTPRALRGLSVSLDNVGDVMEVQGEWAKAQALYEESLGIARELAENLGTPETRRDLSVSLNKVGSVMQAQGDGGRAQSLYEASLKIRRELADELGTPEARRDLSVSLNNIGGLMQAGRELLQAQALYEESQGIRRELAGELGTPEARRDLGVSLWRLALLADAQGRHDEVCALLREALPIFEDLNDLLATSQARAELEQIREWLDRAGCRS